MQAPYHGTFRVLVLLSLFLALCPPKSSSIILTFKQKVKLNPLSTQRNEHLIASSVICWTQAMRSTQNKPNLMYRCQLFAIKSSLHGAEH